MTKSELMAAEVERYLLEIKTEQDLVIRIPAMLEAVESLVEKIAEARNFDGRALHETFLMAHMFACCSSAHHLGLPVEHFNELAAEGYRTYVEMQMGEPVGNA